MADRYNSHCEGEAGVCFSHLEVAQLRAVGNEIEGVWGSVQAVEAALHSNGTHCHLLVDQLQETEVFQ